jgi:hypothetical protein
MNIFQSLNLGMFGLTLAALVAGFAKIPAPLRQRPVTLWLFVSFFILFRLKMFLDDHKYFGSTKTKNVHFKIGFMVGFLSWLFWALGAWSVQSLRDAYFFVGVAILIATLWIIVVAVRKRPYREQYIWLATNTLFVLILWISYRRNITDADWVTWTALSIAIVLVLIDLVFSKSIPELAE